MRKNKEGKTSRRHECAKKMEGEQRSPVQKSKAHTFKTYLD